MVGICLINEKMYLDERVRKVILEKFQGISFAGPQEGYFFYRDNKEKLSKSLSLNGTVIDENLRSYIDEPISNPNVDNKNLDFILSKHPKSIIGELNKSTLLNLKNKYPEASFTYTAYREFWFRFLWWNVRKWWKDQRETWNWMFNNMKVDLLWVHLIENDNIIELINYGLSKGKDVFIYVPDITVDQFLIKIKGII